MATITLPGLIDAHVHLREPGGEQKEEIATGTAAALAGGIVAVLDMPNNTPPIVDAAGLAAKAQRMAQRACCDYGLFLGAGDSTGTDFLTSTDPEMGSGERHREDAKNAKNAFLQGAQYAPFRDAKDSVLCDPLRPSRLCGSVPAAGLKLYLTPTFGPLRLESLAALLALFRAWPEGKPIAVHAEGMSMAIPIGLAQLTGKHVHICHVARAAEIALVRAAKERGAPVTCEVAPHHLFLDRHDADRLGPFGSMKPALGEPEDVDALWRNLAVIDLVASDHAPHTLEEKRGPTPPPGVPGVETMLPLLLDAVARERLELRQVVALLHDGPRRVYGLRPPEADVEVEIGGKWPLSAALLHSKCGWTPYEGRVVAGRVARVALRGQTVVENGQVLAQPGSGRPLVRV